MVERILITGGAGYHRIVNAFKFTVIEGGYVTRRKLDRSTAVVHEIPEWSRKS